MKKSNFVSMILGTISAVFFALGMCMAMVKEWNAFQPGIFIGVIGLLFALVTVIVWRKMEKKAPIQINGKMVFHLLLGLIGALALGIGMCFVMVWGNLIPGVMIGLIGIVVLLSLIPICKGLK